MLFEWIMPLTIICFFADAIAFFLEKQRELKDRLSTIAPYLK
jgi:hypothetical protein